MRILALLLGFVLDLIFGDPRIIYHPVCVIGNAISFLEKGIRKLVPKTERGLLWGGVLEVCVICVLSFGIPYGVLKILYLHLPALGFVLETFWCFQLFAAKSLKTESMKVYDRLKHGTIEEARYAVSMIVGRDTQALSETGVTKAAVETIAESTADGVIAPMFYMLLGGAPLMFLYKGVNTMDSMLGYKNEKYLYYGRAAAKLDDVFNFLPARIAGALMATAAGLCGLNLRHAWAMFLRDRRNHASPNSAHTEAAMAGALMVQLAGDAWYFGTLYKKPFIGEDLRPVECEDIVRANRLMYVTAILGVVLSALCFGIWTLSS